jgi:hypothetical protein
VLWTGHAHAAVDGVLVDAARHARRVSNDRLDKALRTLLTLEVAKAEAYLAHAGAMVCADGLVLEVALDFEHCAALAALADGAGQTLCSGLVLGKLEADGAGALLARARAARLRVLVCGAAHDVGQGDGGGRFAGRCLCRAVEAHGAELAEVGLGGAEEAWRADGL